MPIFRYSGYDQEGLQAKGTIEADGQRDAASRIKAKGIYPKVITEEFSSFRPGIFRKYSPLVLAGITRRLSTLLSSGVTLVDAINSLSAEQKGAWRGVLIDVKERISAGASLARAMQAYQGIFPDFYIGMISAGENSGTLPDVLGKLADFLETEAGVKDRVQTALIYPLFMACVSVFIVMFLFVFVIPKITKVFEETSASLPFITVVLIWISTAFKNLWWLILLAASGSAAAFRWVRRNRKELIDSLLLKDPTGILTGLYMLRFTMTMSFLLSGGLPILKAMQLTSKATGNAVLEGRIMSAQDLVSQGAKLSSSLEGFPPTLLQIISTGEQTGKLAEVLKRTAESYESEFERNLQRSISLLEPVLILAMGLIVGFIVVAVLLPIFEMNQAVR